MIPFDAERCYLPITPSNVVPGNISQRFVVGGEEWHRVVAEPRTALLETRIVYQIAVAG